MKKKIFLIATLLSAITLMMPFSARAVTVADPCTKSGSSSQLCASSGNDDISKIISVITDVMFYIIGGLAVIMIIYSGIMYVISTGNATRVTNAKNTLLYSVVGLIVAILAYAIVNFVVGKF